MEMTIKTPILIKVKELIIASNRQVVAYLLQDQSNNFKEVTKEQLKDALYNNRVILVQYRLSSNNRIVKRSKHDTEYFMNRYNGSRWEDFIEVDKYIVNSIIKYCDTNTILNFAYKPEIEASSELLGLPRRRITANKDIWIVQQQDKYKNLTVVSTKKKWALPYNCTNLFSRINVREIALGNINCDNVQITEGMFSNACILSIVIPQEMNNIKNARKMFSCSLIDNLNIHKNFIEDNNMNLDMFSGSHIKNIDSDSCAYLNLYNKSYRGLNTASVYDLILAE